MEGLSFLNNKTEEQFVGPRYCPFDKLPQGRYRIDEFFTMDDEKFKSGLRLCIKVDGGSRYMILPKRFMDSTVNVQQLNAGIYDLIFVEKKNYNLVFHFEAGSDNIPCSTFPHDLD